MDRRHRWLVGVGIALAASVIAVVLGRIPVVRGVEWLLYDLRMRRTVDPGHAPANIAIVEIDEASLRDLEPFVGRWPWPRVLHAHLLDYLARAPARLVVYDVLFLDRDRRLKFELGGAEWSGEESDKALVEATAKAGNVIYAAEATFTGANQPAAAADPYAGLRDPGYHLSPDIEIDTAPTLTPPFTELARASLGFGHNRFVLDDEGALRRVVPFVRYGGRDVPLLGVAAYLLASHVPSSEVHLAPEGLRLGARQLPLLAFAIPRFEGEAGSRVGRHSWAGRPARRQDDDLSQLLVCGSPSLRGSNPRGADAARRSGGVPRHDCVRRRHRRRSA